MSSCATTVPNIEIVAPVYGIPGVAALAQMTNSDDHRRLTIPEYLDFLYAQKERPNPSKLGDVLPAKGPAMCMSSVDYQKNETTIAQLCVKGKCTYEQQQALNRLRSFRESVEKTLK